MKKYGHKHCKVSFLKSLSLYFIFLVIIPILCVWWLYEKVLTYYYVENYLFALQKNMESSLAVLENTINAANNTFVALEGNQEIVYYLEYRPYKKLMTYGTYKRVYSFCNELQKMTPYLEKVTIYCDSELPIYAYPFVEIEEIVLEDSFFDKLVEADGETILWRISDVATQGFPSLYAYKKLFADNYIDSIGYIELELSSRLLSDYFEMISGLSNESPCVWSLYHENTPIYSSYFGLEEDIMLEDVSSWNDSMIYNGKYRNYIKLLNLDLKVVCTGRLADVPVMPFSNMPSIFFSAIFALLLVLFMLFFCKIFSFFKRILAFSSFIQKSDPDSLLLFQIKRNRRAKIDEVDILIDSYNKLISGNTSLISKIRKLELITQETRFQALQSQIHPHFIYGTLEMIRMTALQNKDKMVASLIFSLSEVLRYSVSVSTKAVTLREELKIAGHYLEIQKMRYVERIMYRFQIDENLLNMEMPSFVLQPLLENAVVYGVCQTLDPCTLVVEAYENDSYIVFSVTNTGKMITVQRMQEVNDMLSGKVNAEEFQGSNNGVALKNIKERLHIFFDGRASVRLDLQDGKTATIIKIAKNKIE